VADEVIEVDMVEAARIAKVSVDGIRALLRREQVPVRRYGSRKVYVRLADLIALLNRRSVS